MAGPTTFPVTHCGPYGEDARLAGWRANVGATVAIDLDVPGEDPPSDRVFTLLNWNVWVGRGRLTEVIELIRAGAYAGLGIAADAPLIVLLQEAYRVDDTIPTRSNGWTPREIIVRARPREDVVDAAVRLGLHLRYAPSMRNGPERADRGSAILSSLPFGETWGLELPLVLQRRVTVAATFQIGGRKLTLCSVHLDPWGPPGHRWLGAAGRAHQTQHLLAAIHDDPVIVGADLNINRGRAERCWRMLDEADFSPGVPPALPTYGHTYHAIPRLLLDYVLVRDRHGIIHSTTVHRLDENAGDRGGTVFGSDHHPLLARVELA